MATHSSVLAWRIPGMGDLGGLPSMGSHRVGHDWSDLAAAAAAAAAAHLGCFQCLAIVNNAAIHIPIQVIVWRWSRSVMSKLFATPWTVACQAPLSMRFSRQAYWSGLPFPSPSFCVNKCFYFSWVYTEEWKRIFSLSLFYRCEKWIVESKRHGTQDG